MSKVILITYLCQSCLYNVVPIIDKFILVTQFPHWKHLTCWQSWIWDILLLFFCCDVNGTIDEELDIPRPLRPRQNGRHFHDDIFTCIFLNENIWILIELSLIPWICYKRCFSEFCLSIWNQLFFNQRLQLFVQSPQPYLLIFAWRNKMCFPTYW